MHWLRFKREFEEKMEEQMRKERAEATHRARAAAWEAEKAEAQANRVSADHLCKLPGVTMVCAIALPGSNKGQSMSGYLGSRKGGGGGGGGGGGIKGVHCHLMGLALGSESPPLNVNSVTLPTHAL